MINSADLDQKPTDLDVHCLQRQGISGFSRKGLLITVCWVKNCRRHFELIFVLFFLENRP